MKKKILVVDDDRVTLKIITKLLKNEGHKVVTAEDGFSALNILVSFVPDIMLIDLIMPKIGGDKLCQLVRKMPHLKECYLVILSAAIVDLDFSYKEVGANACIAKESYEIMAENILAAVEKSDSYSNNTSVSVKSLPDNYRPTIQQGFFHSTHLESIMDSLPEGILEVSSDQKVVYANSTAISLLGVPIEEILDSNILELFEGDMNSQMDSLLKSDENKLDEIGHDAPVLLNGRKVIIQNLPFKGESLSKILLLKDVTEHKLVEGALSEAMDYIENIINSMADSLLVIKPDLTINLANRAACELLGYTRHELFGRPIDAVFYDGISFKKSLLNDLLEKHFVNVPELSFKTKTGQKIPVSFQGSLINRDDIDNFAGIICIAHDMREVKELQAQVSQAEKMAATGVLSAGVAHEIKNPLAIILQGIEFLKSSFSSKSNSAILQDAIERIQEAALRADQIVKGLLSFSRQSSVSFEELDVSSVIEETIPLVEHQFNIQNIKIVREFPSDLKKIKADKNQMKQVFINLFINAVEAMPQGGTITISMRPDETSEHKYLEIAITDTGHGIPDDDIQRAFEPFFSTKTQTLNTGLGLSVTRGIIEKHHGTIKIISGTGKGTKIIISLPYNFKEGR